MNTARQAYNAIMKPTNILQHLYDYKEETKRVIDGTLQIHGDTAIIAFTASNSTQDWLTDAMIFPRRISFAYETVFAHGGYLKHYMIMRQQLLDAVRPYKKVVITGYSLGASIALLASLDIQSLYTKDVKTVVFDPLRTFWLRRSQTYFNDNTRMIQTVSYSNSTVYKLCRMLGFKHGGKLIHVGTPYKWYKYCNTDHKIKWIEPYLDKF